MQKNILLLTATVQPPVGALHLVRTDLKLRKQDYLGALHFYLDELQKGTFDKIVLIDNSNTPLGFLAELVTSRNLSAFVELISYDGIDYPPEVG